MKKLFTLFLALSLLFLTACNTKPPVGTNDGTGSSNSSGTDIQSPSSSIPQDVIIAEKNENFINLPSRVVFHNGSKNVYYSKADGQTYIYCFDPLCDHSEGKCLAQPITLDTVGINFWGTKFVNNRFWCTATFLGKIISFNFDGTDMKVEYDAGYQVSQITWSGDLWNPDIMAYGSYLYLEQNDSASEDGKVHTLRFNTETREMEDLTEKTGNYIYPNFFYNGNIYGYDESFSWCKCNLDLTDMEAIDEIPVPGHYSGSRMFNVTSAGVEVYDMKTSEVTEISNSVFGVPEGAKISIQFVDANYIYYNHSQKELVGYYPHPKTGNMTAKYRWNDGKLYRANHDGTNVICIYDNSDFEFGAVDTIIFDDKIILGGQYVGVRNGIAENWGSGYYVGTIGSDGKIDELKLVEVLQ
ncbi:MAG: hypothetical protein IJD59_10175 [Clostridia bacterium]|nr:hypothetical protein [Clostridia bacterium]